MKTELKTDPNKRQEVIRGKKVSFVYPAHFTASQRGVTSPGRPVLNFSKMDNLAKTKNISRIKSPLELKMLALFKDREKKTRKISRKLAWEIFFTLPSQIKTIYCILKYPSGPALYF